MSSGICDVTQLAQTRCTCTCVLQEATVGLFDNKACFLFIAVLEDTVKYTGLALQLYKDFNCKIILLLIFRWQCVPDVLSGTVYFSS